MRHDAAMEFDVCLSFAGEDRTYVRAVADELVGRAVRVFYDEYEEATLWGKNLYTHLDDVYQRQARYCVMFVSEHYVRKFWTAHERESAQARALVEPREYILPARFDRTEVPGLRTTTAYVELQDRAPASLAALICKKLGMSPVGATGELTVHWFGAATVPTAGGADTVAVYQGLPVSTALPHLEAAVGTALRSLAASARPDGPSTYWSHREDRRFDRLYATSAVATALGQLGLPVHGGLLAPAVDYLTGADPGSIDDRAAAMGLLTLGLLDAAGTEALLAALTERLINTGPNRGSFLLRQGPTAGIPEEHWIPSHANGAAFHACHVADLLLHIPADQPQNRRRAEPLLGGVRDFLLRSLNDHGRFARPAGRYQPAHAVRLRTVPRAFPAAARRLAGHRGGGADRGGRAGHVADEPLLRSDELCIPVFDDRGRDLRRPGPYLGGDAAGAHHSPGGADLDRRRDRVTGPTGTCVRCGADRSEVERVRARGGKVCRRDDRGGTEFR